MVDFKAKLKEQRQRALKVFIMDPDGYQYWAGYSAQSCFEHMVTTQGADYAQDIADVQAVEDLTAMKMETEDGRVVTFRERLDELIELEVAFPRFFCGTEV